MHIQVAQRNGKLMMMRVIFGASVSLLLILKYITDVPSLKETCVDILIFRCFILFWGSY